MGDIFGRQFEAQYGALGGGAFETWTEGLSDLSDQQIGAGFQRMVKAGSKFPPNLIEFRLHCKPNEDMKRVQTYSDRNFTEERLSGLLPAPHRTETAKAAAKEFFEKAAKL